MNVMNNTTFTTKIQKLFTKYIKPNYISILLFAILFFAVITKSWHLYHPNTYVFDEVYVGFTAEEYVKGNIKAWVWDYPTPKGFAYDWSHPPMGRHVMTLPIYLLEVSSFSRRVAPMLAGVVLTFMVFQLAKLLFPKRPAIWLFAAAFSALDGLLLVLSRTGLADTILATFLVSTIYFLLRQNYLVSALFFGAAVSTKWTAVYTLGFIGLVLLTYFPWKKRMVLIGKNLLHIAGVLLFYLTIGAAVYLLSYSPLIINYGFEKFWHLQQQMYWYHTGLNATHPYQSPALSWPILYRPVWFWVEYGKNTVSNIYALGNPLIFWGGLGAVFFTLYQAITTKSRKLWYLLLAYASFWVPWTFSPRIMFLYHYTPAIPFLTIILAYALDSVSRLHRHLKYLPAIFLIATFLVFWFFYPYWTGIPIPKDEVSRFQWLQSWK